MRNVLNWSLLMAALAVVQPAFAPRPGWLLQPPDLFLAAIMLAAVYADSDDIYVAAPLMGWLRDIAGGGVVGSSAMSFTLIALTVRSQKSRLDFDSYLLDISVAAAILTDAILFFGWASVAAGRLLGLAHSLPLMLGRAITTALFIEACRAIWTAMLHPFLRSRQENRKFREV
jgi:rod shape-determining protein MreD